MASKTARAVTAGVATWRTLSPLDGNVLLIVNSPHGDEHEVSMALDAVERCAARTRLHIIATAAWQPWLSDRGASSDRVLYSIDAAGDELELNYFLETSTAVRWIVGKQFTAIVGSAPHNLYNEEVKGIFERRIGAILGAGRFLAHTLPEPYVFVLTLEELLHRFNRAPKAEQYGVFCRELLADLHRGWVASGRPRVADTGSFDEVSAVLERHLGPAVLSWDEASPIPLHRLDTGGRALEYLLYVEGVLHRAVDAMANLQALTADLQQTLVQLQDEVNIRDHLLGELDQKAHELRRATGTQQTEISELQHASSAQQAEINRRDATIAELSARAVELRRTIDLQEEETESRDRRLAELHEELGRETSIRDRRLADLQQEHQREIQHRDRRLAELHEELARELGARDGRLIELQVELAFEVDARDRRLVELHEELAREVRVRDQKLVELYEERKEAVRKRDALISELELECGRLSSGWRGWLVKRR